MAAPQSARPSSRAKRDKVVAAELDDTLNLTCGLSKGIQDLNNKQQQAAGRFKEFKELLAKLTVQIAANEQEKVSMKTTVDTLKSQMQAIVAKTEEYKNGYQTLRAALKKAKEDLEKNEEELKQLRHIKKELESMKDVYESFKAKQKEKVKGAMERMGSGNDFTCKNIHWQAWVKDLEEAKKWQKFQDDIDNATGAMKEYQERKKEESRKVMERMLAGQTAGLVTVVWQSWCKVVAEEKACKEAEAKLMAAESEMSEWQKRKKEEAKAVFARVAAGNDMGLLDTCITAWYRVLQEEKAIKEAEAKLMQADAEMSDYQRKKKEEAKAVFARVAAGNDTGLLDTCLTGWYRVLEENKKAGETEKAMKAEAARVQEMMKGKKAEARKVLERNLGGSVTATLTTTVRTWQAWCADEKRERELIAKSEAQLKEFQQKKRGEAMSVVERMTGGKTNALLSEVIMIWTQMVSEEKRAREIRAVLRKQFADQMKDLDEKIQIMEEELADKKDELDDMTEELTMSRSKNQALRTEFARMKSIQDEMGKAFD